MKFIVKNNVVSINTKHPQSKLVRYAWENNFLYSIVQREIIRRSAKRPPGDNCPMLYALKNSDGLTTSTETVNKLYEYTSASIKEYFGYGFDFDLIVPMPSSCDIPTKISNIFQNLYQINVLDIKNTIVKKDVSEVIMEISRSNEIAESVKQAIITALNRNKGTLNIKNVKVEYRHYLFPIFKPLKSDLFNKYKPRKILLIDDIFTSGLTLRSVKQILCDIYPNAEISALTLFSPLPKQLNKID